MIHQYFLFENGKIVNAVASALDKAAVQTRYPDYVVKREDECALRQLEAYRFWHERP